MMKRPKPISKIFPSRGIQFTGKPAIRVAFACALGTGAATLCGILSACTDQSRTLDGRKSSEIRILVESSPATMNPRFTLDAIGQRLQMFVFRSLTRLDADLEPQPDLAESWKTEDAGKTYRFRIRKNLHDRDGAPITAVDLEKCFRNYLEGEPRSPHRASFPNWRSVETKGDDLLIRLAAPDPYLPKNLTVLRYFSVSGDAKSPCREPTAKETLVPNGSYSIDPYRLRMESSVRLRSLRPDAPDLVFEIVRDETSRIFKLLNGQGDAFLNSFSPTKTEWVARNGGHGFRLIERVGTNTGYLAFNLEDPILSKLPVRQAIAHAIDRETLVRTKIRGEAKVASSFLVASLPEAIPAEPFPFDPAFSEKLLDEAGYRRGADGVRFRIKYKSTTNKTGLELAQIYREMLGKIGVALDLETVEPSVFFASIRRGNFQMYMSQWVGVSDGSIFHRTLHSKNPDNRVHYRNAEMDAWLESSIQELNFKKRKELLGRIQRRMLADLPYFPLWHWTNALLLRDTIVPPKPGALSLSGSYAPFADLRFLK